eukprot:IDg22950t1
MSAQVSEKDFLETPEKYNKNLNSILAHLAKLPVLPLRFPKLGKNTLSLKVYSDSSYANNPDDSLSLFDVITKVSVTAEKRLIIDLKIVRRYYATKEIEKVGFVRTLNNPADSLTKPKRCHILEKILTEATISHQIEQW